MVEKKSHKYSFTPTLYGVESVDHKWDLPDLKLCALIISSFQCQRISSGPIEAARTAR
jgi:hypothetical protein